MAKFIFRLQSFLSLKEKLEEQKKLEYGRAAAKFEREKQKLSALEAERDTVLREFSEKVKSKILPDEFARYNSYINVMKDRIIAQKQEVAKAAKEAEAKRLVLVEAMRERKSIQTLKDKDFEEYKEEEKHAEARVVDEIVSYRLTGEEE
ncbi:hypothetical protein FACS189490_13020 [Clostridia bacterium]|nr:hypothetical protein FACS189490_13020 [Clostridia bacterium]